MNLLIHPNYLPAISQLKLIIDSKKLIFEINDNFQKQTHRNRTYIYGANGLLLLSIPVIHSQKNRKKFKDVKIAYDYDWLTQHLKSFQISYRSSPFFEYYEDKLVDLYVRREKYLYDFNLRSIDVLFDMLQINLEYDFTKGYSEQYSDILDYRNNYKKLNSSFKIKEYTQVFESKHGYIENLSALDLIFNEGPNAINFLKTS
ncbi:MAG: WbqC family protein [Bacteroidota bacterium]|nr:WbqC family protein [Bacteroidota bacterium]|tara:strand:- start:3 stop:608 length:606 start_codon:yes stop_codon:yes gene_type:complete